MIQSRDPIHQKRTAMEELADGLKRAYDERGITAGLRISKQQMQDFCEEYGFLTLLTIPEVLAVNVITMRDHQLTFKCDREQKEFFLAPSDVTYHDTPIKHLPKI